MPCECLWMSDSWFVLNLIVILLRFLVGCNGCRKKKGNCSALENGVGVEFRVVRQVLNSWHFMVRILFFMMFFCSENNVLKQFDLNGFQRPTWWNNKLWMVSVILYKICKPMVSRYVFFDGKSII